MILHGALTLLLTSLLLGAQLKVLDRDGTTQAAADLLDAYESGKAWAAGVDPATLPRLVNDLKRVAPRWVGPAGAPNSGRRRLLVATIALELINDHFDAAWQVSRDSDPGFGRELLAWTGALLQQEPPTSVERAWHLAAIGLIERAYDRLAVRPGSVTRVDPSANVLLDRIAHAEARFPGDGQWALARTVEAELALPHTGEGRLELTSRQLSSLRRVFGVAYRTTAEAEARVRWAHLELRRGQAGAALSELDRIQMPEDVVVRYWWHLFRGRALRSEDRTSEAIDSLRAALTQVPGAQAATVELAGLLATNGDPTEASVLVNDLLTGAPSLDPWRIYRFPAYRYWPSLIEHLRATVRR